MIAYVTSYAQLVKVDRFKKQMFGESTHQGDSLLLNAFSQYFTSVFSPYSFKHE